MNNILQKFANISRYVALALTAGWTLLLIISTAMGFGNEASVVINGIFTILVIGAVGVGLCIALALKKEKAVIGLGAIVLVITAVGDLQRPVEVQMAEGFIAYGIIRILGVLALLGAAFLLIIAWFNEKFLSAKLVLLGHGAVLCYCCFDILAAIVMFILCIVYGAQGYNVGNMVMLGILRLFFAPLVAALYFILFVKKMPEINFRKASKAEEAPAAAVEAPVEEEPKEEAPVEEPVEEEPVKEDEAAEEEIIIEEEPAEEPKEEKPE